MRWLPLALSLSLALGACDHAMSSLPSPPASARALEGGGAYESRMGQVVADMRRRLAQHGLGAIEVEAYQLPSDATWEQVAAHYGGIARRIAAGRGHCRARFRIRLSLARLARRRACLCGRVRRRPGSGPGRGFQIAAGCDAEIIRIALALRGARDSLSFSRAAGRGPKAPHSRRRRVSPTPRPSPARSCRPGFWRCVHRNVRARTACRPALRSGWPCSDPG